MENQCPATEHMGIPIYDGITRSKNNFFFWTSLMVPSYENMIRGLIEEDIMDAAASECNGYIDICGFRLDRVGRP